MKHVVKQGESIELIAWQHGHTLEAVWNHPQNEELRSRRESPHVLRRGDEVFIPPVRAKTETVQTGATHRVQLKSASVTLHLVLQGPGGKPYDGVPYKLVVGSETIEGSTDGGGVLQEKIPVDATSATLHVNGRELTLDLRHLDPHTDTDDEGLEGLQARMRNLGYDCGDLMSFDDRSKTALRSFQRDEGLEVTGELDDATVARVLERHEL